MHRLTVATPSVPLLASEPQCLLQTRAPRHHAKILGLICPLCSQGEMADSTGELCHSQCNGYEVGFLGFAFKNWVVVCSLLVCQLHLRLEFRVCLRCCLC